MKLLALRVVGYLALYILTVLVLGLAIGLTACTAQPNSPPQQTTISVAATQTAVELATTHGYVATNIGDVSPFGTSRALAAGITIEVFPSAAARDGLAQVARENAVYAIAGQTGSTYWLAWDDSGVMGNAAVDAVAKRLGQ